MTEATKTAVVTGASRGIGREIALRLANDGIRVALVGRSLRDLEMTKRLAEPSTTEVFGVELRDPVAIGRFVSALHSSFGEVDILVNVAGVWHDEHRKYQGPLLSETSTAEIAEVIQAGLHACFLLSRQLVPGMMRKHRGKILQISCGFASPREAVGWMHYYVTNKAIEAFTEGLAAELRPYDIQVNCIAPWFVATEAVRRFYPEQSKRALEPQEVAKLASFLVSSEADHISGQIIELRSNTDVV